jgi:hypothetical protein
MHMSENVLGDMHGMELSEPIATFNAFHYQRSDTERLRKIGRCMSLKKLWIESGLVPHQDQLPPIVWRMENRLDIPQFVKSFGRLTHSHSIFRTRILKRGQTCVQENRPCAGSPTGTRKSGDDPGGSARARSIHTPQRLDRRPALESGLVHVQLFRPRSAPPCSRRVHSQRSGGCRVL